ncbi:MAG: ATP-binding cassette domain-containing protein [Defluviitaleaceae bacterium]|nr:ATP-binding cassette domain-containing protein [Defluviitaleaceae bacterium]
MALIEVMELRKEFIVYKKGNGLGSFIKGMVSPEKKIVKAVDGISLNIEKGEIVGFLGPNGAGKSTTIKMMCGILVPDGGSVNVDGLRPYKERKRSSGRIGAVFGQRTQLWWNLPVSDSFKLLKTIYQIPDGVYEKNMSLYSEVLEIDKYMDTPVRQLSLGQRMRVEIAASLLHDPAILYLDEPTIGLDTIAKERIREFIIKINAESGVTIILTTHDMQDVKEVCQRLVVINSGKIIVDDSLGSVINKYDQEAVLEVRFNGAVDNINLPDGADIKKRDGSTWVIVFDKTKMAALDILSKLALLGQIEDFSLRGASIEDIIKRIYGE